MSLFVILLKFSITWLAKSNLGLPTEQRFSWLVLKSRSGCRCDKPMPTGSDIGSRSVSEQSWLHEHLLSMLRTRLKLWHDWYEHQLCKRCESERSTLATPLKDDRLRRFSLLLCEAVQPFLLLELKIYEQSGSQVEVKHHSSCVRML